MADEIQTNAIPEPQTAPPFSENASGLRDKRVRPEGVVPKQAQGYVVAGLAVLILMAVMFSKNHARPADKDATSAPVAVSTDMNQRKIQELEQDLSADQRQSQQQAEAQRAGTPSSPATAATVANTAQTGGVASPATQLQPATESPRDPVADAEKALSFKARFASNLVSAADGASRPLAESADFPEGTAARPSSLPQAPATQVAPAPATTGNKRAPEVNVNSALGQPYVVFEGTTIDTVLVNRLDGEFAGPLKVMVTNPIYSQDRQHLLIPEGTFILGDVQKVAGPGQKRLAVTFHRLLMPDGYSVDLDQFHGLDQAGATGLKDKVNNHYVEIFGASIALGVIAGAAQATNQNKGYNQSGTEAYKSGIASSLSQSSANVLDRFINIPPTITIREGHRIKVHITQDMLLPAYEYHTIPSDF
jgi:type IV secretion system protein VirB10